MKFTIERDVLTDAVSWAARSLPQRPPVPVLSGLLITAEKNFVSVTSFDYETSAQLDVEADIDVEGTVLVNGRLLNEIVRSLPTAPVSVELQGSKVVVTCRNSHFELATMPVEEYPALPQLPESSGAIDGVAFNRAVQQVTSAASKDDSLPILAAVKIEIESDSLTFLATDRYRLAMKELNWVPHDPSISTEVLVKSKTLAEVAKSLGGGGELHIHLSRDDEGTRLLGFSSGGRRTTSLLVDGDYPKIRSLFPETSPIKASVDFKSLVDAAKRVALVAERNNPLRLSFTQGQVILEAGAGDNATANETVPCTLEGEEITVGFNSQYLIDGLNVLDGDAVKFAFTTAPKPVLMTGMQDDHEQDINDFRYLLMPIRL